MKIAIAGASGFIGTHLTSFFKQRGDIIVPLPHSYFEKEDIEGLRGLLMGCEVVMNVAGASIDRRWTTSYKEELVNSRVMTTRLLVYLINTMEQKPSLFISTSAGGYYPTGKTYTEYDHVHGDDFLAYLCLQWESEAKKVTPEVRLVITRFAVVLSHDGGAFQKMATPLRLGVSIQTGPNDHPFAWIHIQDLVSVMGFVVDHSEIEGVLNLVAPEELNNRQFATIVAQTFHAKWITMIPPLFLRLKYGEGVSFFLNTPSFYPQRLIEFHYPFIYPTLRKASQEIATHFQQV